jgi:hypothetical protein
MWQRFKSVRSALFVPLLVVAASTAVRAQDSVHTWQTAIRGRVTVDSGRPVVGAQVTITMAPDRSFKQVKTDSTGSYEIIFEHGTGDYLVHVAAPGVETFRKRVMVPRGATVSRVEINVSRTNAQQLTAVVVSARRPKPRRGGDFGNGPGPGAAERIPDALTGAVSPDLLGNLGAIAATVPGVVVTGQGNSVGGLSPGQNSSTLNGMSFSGTDVPRDAMTTVRVSTSTYDPSRGWFGGLQENVDLASGVVGSLHHVHFNMNAPALQYTDPVSAKLGGRFTSFQAGIGAQDHFHFNKLEYNYGADVGRRVSSVASLETAPDNILGYVGIAPDSAARLVSVLRSGGLPIASRLTSQVIENASFIGQIGTAPEDWLTFQPVNTVWQLLGYAKVLQTTSVGVSPTSLSGSAGTRMQQQFMLQAHLSTFVHGYYLAEGRSALSLSHSYETPNLELPAGHVLLASHVADAAGSGPGVTSVGFGGYDALLNDVRQGTWETRGELQLYPPRRATHRVKLTGDLRFDWTKQGVGADTLGGFTFNSVDDVAANRPTSFTRLMGAPAEVGKEWNGFIAVGDWWRKSDSFQLLYGARIEANRFVGPLPNNPLVESAFGVRTDNMPNTIGVSPRIGFTWTLRGFGGSATSPLGNFVKLPTAYIRGGIGEFRGFLSPLLASGGAALTGLPAAQQSLRCIGPAAPTPAWSAYLTGDAAIPTQCGNSPVQSSFSDIAPAVQVFDKAYTAPKSWRANVVYGSTAGKLTYSVEGIAALNLNQPGRTDLNFANSPYFRTSDEGRPVFVSSSSVLAGSGVVATTDARLTPAFGHVFENVSRLRSTSRQATLTLAPDLDGLKRWFASFSYTLASTHALGSGFDGSTFESPVAREWTRGDFDVRHQFLLQGGVTRHGVSLTFFGRVQSGLPYTPLVSSDVNGDGLVNDRAFVFDPASSSRSTSSSSLASAMRTLLSSGSSGAGDCLERQLGRASERNSCEGPWTTSLNAQMTYAGKLPLTTHSGTVAVAFVNPLGGLDQLLHGAALHGWGTAALPDPVLYNVRGFDPATRRFTYEVNPRFGDTRSSLAMLRTPFRITLDVRIDLSAPSERQFLDRWVQPGRSGFAGQRLPASAIKRSYDRITPDPYSAIFAESDSLMLSLTQLDALEKAQNSYKAARDAEFDSLSQYLAGLGDQYSVSEALRRQHDALNAVWELGHVDVKRTLPLILSRIQLRMLPYPASLLYTTPDDVRGMKILSQDQ